ncbi:hypothetical protein ALC62_02598, partial [Cyphomyrmex costatus]
RTNEAPREGTWKGRRGRERERGRESEEEAYGRTVRTIHTSDVSERMRPSQSDVRREYKSRRVIHPSVRWLRQCAAVARCTYAHARETGRASTHRCGRTRPPRRSKRSLSLSLSSSCFSSFSYTAVCSSAFRFPSSSLFSPPCSSLSLRTPAPSSPPPPLTPSKHPLIRTKRNHAKNSDSEVIFHPVIRELLVLVSLLSWSLLSFAIRIQNDYTSSSRTLTQID